MEIVQSALETQNKSVVECLGKLQNQIDETKEHMENNMTEMMEKIKKGEKQTKRIENDAAKTNQNVTKMAIQMNTLESGMTKTNKKLEEVDGQLYVFYKELKDNSK